jgi:hypothetical protein
VELGGFDLRAVTTSWAQIAMAHPTGVGDGREGAGIFTSSVNFPVF